MSPKSGGNGQKNIELEIEGAAPDDGRRSAILQPHTPPSQDNILSLSAAQQQKPQTKIADYQQLLFQSSSRIAYFMSREPFSGDTDKEDILNILRSDSTFCIDASRSFAASRGYSGTEDLRYVPLRLLFPGDLSGGIFGAWIENNMHLTDFETQEVQENGKKLHFLNSVYGIREDGYYTRFWYVARDITQYKKAIIATQEAENHYRTLVERPGLILIRRSPDGFFSYVTPQVQEILGLTLEDFNRDPESYEKLVHPEDIDEIRKITSARSDFSRSSDSSRSDFSCRTAEAEYRLLCADGGYRWFFERQTCKIKASGKVEYFDSIVLDIQERKKLEAELVQAQKMETIGKLSGGIAHDFNNHLTAILGQISLSINELDPGHPCYQRLAMAEQAALRCAEMTTQLLSFSRKSDHDFRPLDLKQLISETTKLASHVLPANIELATCIDPGVRGINANFVQIQQVLMNLIVNARDAMPDGGIIEVEASPVKFSQPGALEDFPNTEPGSYILMKVKDKGIGIPASHLEQIFEPFFTTKKNSSGTGLGLSMVYSIVRDHRGCVHLKSEVNLGTEALILLPAVEQVPEPHKTGASARVLKGSECILVADDDTMVLSMVTAALSMQGYQILSASNGEEALRLFMENRDSISLVLVDQTMPRLTGREVTDKIFGISPDMPVILTSGYDKSEFDPVLAEKNRVAFLNKPYPLPDLLGLVRDLIDEEISPGPAGR